MCGWAKMTRRAGQYQYWGLENATSNSTGYSLIGYPASGEFEISNTVGGASFASSPTDETWFFWAITCSGTAADTFKGYWRYANDTTWKTASRAGANFTSAMMQLGNDSYDEYCNACFDNTMVFDAALTQAQLEQIMNFAFPQILESINLWTPHFAGATERLADWINATARNWTAGGTLSDEDGAPLIWDGYASPSVTAASGVNLSGVGNIAGAEVFGTAVITLTVSPGGIAGGEAFGTQSIQVTIASAGGIASGEAFGTPVLSVDISSVGGIASGEAFGGATISAAIAVSGITSDEAFGSADVSVNVSGAGNIASAEGFGTPNVSTAAPVDITDVGNIASAEAFGTPVISLTIAPSGVASGEAFGSSAIQANVAGAGNIAGAEVFGTPVVSTAAPVNISDVGNIANAEAFGNPGILVVLSPAGIASDELFGAPTFVLNLFPSGIPSAEAFGTPAAGDFLLRVITVDSIVRDEFSVNATVRESVSVNSTVRDLISVDSEETP
jgi:hypothetical protein